MTGIAVENVDSVWTALASAYEYTIFERMPVGLEITDPPSCLVIMPIRLGLFLPITCIEGPKQNALTG